MKIKNNKLTKNIFKTTTKFTLCLGMLISGQALAFDSFLIKKIKIQGNQRVSTQTVRNYLTVRPGDVLTQEKSNQIIDNLFDTGFFNDISILRDGQTLIVKVQERPVISEIQIHGNKLIPTKKLQEALDQLGIVRGSAFNQATLESVKNGLLEQYHAQGRFNATIQATMQHAKGKIQLVIEINEGAPLKVKKIQFVGNRNFKAGQLRDQFLLTTSGILTFFTKSDVFSEEKLQASLEKLQAFYLDQGYVRFRVTNVDKQITNDKKHIVLVIHIDEGAVYRLKGYAVTGNFLIPKSKVIELIHLKSGAIFSRQKVIEGNQAVKNFLGEKGYAYPLINTVPKIDDQTHELFLVYQIDAGKRFYVRRVSFKGNYRTSDTAMRRTLRQFEGAMYNSKQVQESIRQLRLLGFLKNINVKMNSVTGEPSLMDLIFNVEEAPSAQATFGVGYSNLERVFINASLIQPNFLGSGNMLGINFKTSRFQKRYSLSYNNPYYTLSGISRGFDVYFTQTNPDEIDLARYSINRIGADMTLGIPLGESADDRLVMKAGLRHIDIGTSSQTPPEVVHFVNEEGSDFLQGVASATWLHNGLDRALFPTEGYYHTLGLTGYFPLGQGDLTYYTADYNARWYYPLNKAHTFIILTRTALGYGDGIGDTQGLPFFENYFTGGINSVAGYVPNTLGPHDTGIDRDPIGGNALATASLGLIFPNFVDKDNLRTWVFIDGGNVFQTHNSYGLQIDTPSLRYSVGLGVEWRSPFGTLEFAVAKALNPKTFADSRKDDEERIFDFTIVSTAF